MFPVVFPMISGDPFFARPSVGGGTKAGWGEGLGDLGAPMGTSETIPGPKLTHRM